VDLHGAVLRELGPGQAFGEIALIDAVPRTATVTALEPSRLLSMDGESFVAAVTGHRGAERVAREVIDAMLPSVSGAPPPRPAPETP
jgi:CRP-like cAMP-binding protein